MRAIGKNILMTPLKEQVKSLTGLILSNEDVAKMRYKRGTIQKVGDEVSGIKEGDLVQYDAMAGHSMLISGQEYTLINERDVVIVE